jgi:hypothetical protein
VGGSGDDDFFAVVMLRVVFRRWFCYMGVGSVFLFVIVSLLRFGDVRC